MTNVPPRNRVLELLSLRVLAARERHIEYACNRQEYARAGSNFAKIAEPNAARKPCGLKLLKSESACQSRFADACRTEQGNQSRAANDPITKPREIVLAANEARALLKEVGSRVGNHRRRF